ncbi:hypothetical protein [Winogradskyella sp.]|nr:hypothetical protein [Winogradskyella sp.]
MPSKLQLVYSQKGIWVISTWIDDGFLWMKSLLSNQYQYSVFSYGNYQ